MPAYNPKLFQYPYDPAKARQLLKEAGYKGDPNDPLVLWFSDSEPWYSKAAQSIESNLKDVGIYITTKQIRYAELKAKAGTRKTIHLGLMGWLQDYPDPSNFLDPLFNARSATPTAALNRAFYKNPRVNKLLDAAAVETNRTKRLQMYQEAEKIIVADAPLLFLHHTERYVVRQPWVDGFKLHPMWSAVYENVAVNP
jgi:ABC-type transport system substrate-binding protein